MWGARGWRNWALARRLRGREKAGRLVAARGDALTMPSPISEYILSSVPPPATTMASVAAEDANRGGCASER